MDFRLDVVDGFFFDRFFFSMESPMPTVHLVLAAVVMAATDGNRVCLSASAATGGCSDVTAFLRDCSHMVLISTSETDVGVATMKWGTCWRA